MIETRLLRYFVTCAETQNMTKAAQKLFITQSTLSKQIMQLEEELGKPLFVREKRALHLTEDGLFLAQQAQNILKLLDTTERALKNGTETLSGDLKIGCPERNGLQPVSQAIQLFHKQHPNVLLHIRSNANMDELLTQIESEKLNAAIVFGPLRNASQYNRIALAHECRSGLLLPADCALAKKEHIHIRDLRGVPLLLSEQTYVSYQQTDLFAPILDDLNVAGTFDLTSNIACLVEKGVGYALTLESAGNYSGGSVVFRPFFPYISPKLYLVTKKGKTPTRVLLAFLRLFQPGSTDNASDPAKAQKTENTK